MFWNLIIYILSFIGIWIGSGLAISAIERISHRLKLSSFAISFLILGFFTSVSELSVGINAVIDNDPEIYVGNLIGASIVIFMLVIPLLAITGKQIKINEELQDYKLLLPLFVISLPVLLSLDGQVNKVDSIISMSFFILLTFFIQLQRGILEKTSEFFKISKLNISREILRALIGVAIIFISSNFIVDQTMYFSRLLQLSPFLISLVFISIGTNLPELSFVARSLFLKRKNNQVAFGDYLGSAAMNTFLFGALTFWYGKTVYLTNNYLISLGFLIIGLTLFFIFAKSKNTLCRLEGLILFFLYVLFLFTEYIAHL